MHLPAFDGSSIGTEYSPCLISTKLLQSWHDLALQSTRHEKCGWFWVFNRDPYPLIPCGNLWELHLYKWDVGSQLIRSP